MDSDLSVAVYLYACKPLCAVPGISSTALHIGFSIASHEFSFLIHNILLLLKQLIISFLSPRSVELFLMLPVIMKLQRFLSHPHEKVKALCWSYVTHTPFWNLY